MKNKKEKEDFAKAESDVMNVGLDEDVNVSTKEPVRELNQEEKKFVEDVKWYQKNYTFYEPSDIANLGSVVPIAEMININFGILQELRKLNELLNKKE